MSLGWDSEAEAQFGACRKGSPSRQTGGASTAARSESQQAGRSNEGAPISVLVVDDHHVVRERISQIVEADPRLQLAGSAADGDEALEMVGVLRPDVLLLDIFMPRLSGDQVLRALRSNGSETKVIVLTAGPTPELHEALRQRPDSLLYKSATSKTICDQIVSLARGEDWSFGRANLERAMALACARVRLNQREQVVLQLTATGLKLHEIGERLSVSKSVIGAHLQGIREKLEVRTNAAAVAKAYDIGLLSRRLWG